jgi:DNA-binding CsgD family transcriptional regulator
MGSAEGTADTMPGDETDQGGGDTPSEKSPAAQQQISLPSARRFTRPPRGPTVLTPRNRKLAALKGAGLTTKEIAKRLGMKKKNVEVRLSQTVYRNPELSALVDAAREKALNGAAEGAVELVAEIRKQMKDGVERCAGLHRETGAPVMVREKPPMHHMAKALDSFANVAGLSKSAMPWAKETQTARFSFDPKDVDTMKAIAKAFLQAREQPVLPEKGEEPNEAV